MTVLEHGINVNKWFLDLYNRFVNDIQLTMPWRLPAWLTKKSFDRLLSVDILSEYQIWHDIGKPYCKVIDGESKQHFPNHAEVSYNTWIQYSEDTEHDILVGQLIRKDMMAHTAKGESVQEFLSDPLAPSLLITALAEIHSNAAYLDKLNSDSFKIKYKCLDRLGKKLFCV